MKIRIRGSDMFGNLRYITVYDGTVHVYSASGMPLSLSNIAKDAMALRFALEDAASDAQAAVQAVKAMSKLTGVELA